MPNSGGPDETLITRPESSEDAGATYTSPPNFNRTTSARISATPYLETGTLTAEFVAIGEPGTVEPRVGGLHEECREISFADESADTATFEFPARGAILEILIGEDKVGGVRVHPG